MYTPPLLNNMYPFHIIHVHVNQLYRVEGVEKGEEVIDKSKIWPTHLASFVIVYFSPVLINL